MIGKLCSFVIHFVPLFNAKPENNITTQRVGKTCTPNSINITSHAIKELKENTLKETV